MNERPSRNCPGAWGSACPAPASAPSRCRAHSDAALHGGGRSCCYMSYWEHVWVSYVRGSEWSSLQYDELGLKLGFSSCVRGNSSDAALHGGGRTRGGT